MMLLDVFICSHQVSPRSTSGCPGPAATPQSSSWGIAVLDSDPAGKFVRIIRTQRQNEAQITPMSSEKIFVLRVV